ncbi:MAG TPA: bifunctional phosphoglucose/phosphomannose isomerase [Actinomycetota bacterium]|nr:bifunctional phosphoglucose/phosphomannose isomerase [Actinomycetota bacterium]
MTPAGTPSHDLDDPEELAAADPSDFLRTVEALPAQLGEAIGLARAAAGLPPAEGLKVIAVLGMGGSGISGELCRSVLAPLAPVPVVTIRNYDLPAWVGPDTLVFAVSYSGDTEETLSAFRQAAARGARIVAVTTGGALAEEAGAGGYPAVLVPGGLMPRAALGYVGMPPLVVCGRLGLAPGLDASLDEAVEVTARRAAECHRSIPVSSNPAKALAARLVGCLPLVWGSEGVAGAAAYRLKCQLNENAKVLAGWATFPELNHNEVVGLYRSGGDGAPNPAPLGVVVLRHEGEPPRTARRIDVTRSLVSGSVEFVEDVWARGSSPLARLLDLVTTGDHASTYLGIVRGVDPAPIAAIDTLKAALR